MNPNFWKLSQGPGQFTWAEFMDSIRDCLVCIHKDTGKKGGSEKSQAQQFIEAPIGDYFYLTHGNQGIYLLGQFSGPVNYFSGYEAGWLDRPFRFIRSANGNTYEGPHKWWSPNDNSTFTKVPIDEITEFEAAILQPFFGINLKDFGL